MRVVVWIGVAAFLIAGTVAAAEEPATIPENLSEIRMPSSFQLESDGLGGVVGWDQKHHLLARWKGDGKLIGDCRLEDARLPFEANITFATRRDVALLTFLDVEAGSETRRKAAIVDIGRCKVERIITVNGVPNCVAPAPDGWLVVGQVEPPEPGPDERKELSAAIDAGDGEVVHRMLSMRPFYRLLDDHGKVVEEFDLDAALDRLIDEEGLRTFGGPRYGRLVAVGKDVYFLPHAAYELWRLPRGGRPLRRVQPPPCLRTRAEEYVGEEARDRMRQRGVSAPEPSDDKKPRFSYTESFSPALRDFLTLDRLLALVVRDPETGSGRLDVWDTMSERVIAVMLLPPDTGVLSLDETTAWLTKGNEPIRAVPMPDLMAPLDDPCVALAAARRSAERATERRDGSPSSSPPGENGPSPAL